MSDDECDLWQGVFRVMRLCAWCMSHREDKCDAMEEIQEELEAVRQTEQRIRAEVRLYGN